jgi:hypothetical protein
MTDDAQAVAELMRWGAGSASHFVWQRTGDAVMEFEVASPHAVRLVARSATWVLEIESGRGHRSTSLGPTDTPHADVMNSLLRRLYEASTDEFDDADRSGSQAMAQVLRTSADETRDSIWCARAATILAGHAIKDGYGLQARLRLEEAAGLYAAAGDSDSESRMLATLASLPELLRA